MSQSKRMESIPQYVFGTAYDISDESGNQAELTSPVAGDKFKAIIERACLMGCRHFDCAPLYGTQGAIGQIFRSIIGQQDVSRSDLFFTSKLPVNMMRPDKIEESLKRTLNELQLAYLDLFLIHAPFATKFVAHDIYYPKDEDGSLMLDTDNDLEKTWIKMSQLKEQGMVKLIGLSNVNEGQLSRLNSIYHVDVVQNEFHLYNQDETVRDECRKLNVHFEGFAAMGSPYSAAKYGKQSPLEDSLVKELATKYNKTPAQIIISWLKTKELSFVIKSDNMAQLEENLSMGIDQRPRDSSTKTILSDEELVKLDELNRNDRVFYYDNHKGLSNHPEYPFEKRIGFMLL